MTRTELVQFLKENLKMKVECYTYRKRGSFSDISFVSVSLSIDEEEICSGESEIAFPYELLRLMD